MSKMLKELRDEIVKITGVECAHVFTEKIEDIINERRYVSYIDSYIVFYFPHILTLSDLENIIELCKNYECSMTFYNHFDGSVEAVIKPKR